MPGVPANFANTNQIFLAAGATAAFSIEWDNVWDRDRYGHVDAVVDQGGGGVPAPPGGVLVFNVEIVSQSVQTDFLPFPPILPFIVGGARIKRFVTFRNNTSL